MSVRPVTQAEELKAYGHPFVNIFPLFGASQGILTFLHLQRIPFKSNWFIHTGTTGRFLVLSVGGFFVGGIAGLMLFNGWDTIRLLHAHKLDSVHLVHGQKAALREL